MQKIITKQEALTKGLKRYFTGVKCKHGHLSERYINGSCIVCDRIKSARYYKTPKGKKTRAIFFKGYYDLWSKTEKGRALNRKSSNEYYSTRKGKDYKKNYQRKRRSIDIPYKIRENISKRVRTFLTLKGQPKKNSLYTSIGCNNIFLKNWIEKQFKKGMNWKNYGSVWVIDHIKPVSKFKIEDIEKANHYTNLQPLFWRENIIKSDKY